MECYYRAPGTVFTQCFWLTYLNEVSHTLASRVIRYYPSSSDHILHTLINLAFYLKFDVGIT